MRELSKSERARIAFIQSKYNIPDNELKFLLSDRATVQDSLAPDVKKRASEYVAELERREFDKYVKKWGIHKLEFVGLPAKPKETTLADVSDNFERQQARDEGKLKVALATVIGKPPTNIWYTCKI